MITDLVLLLFLFGLLFAILKLVAFAQPPTPSSSSSASANPAAPSTTTRTRPAAPTAAGGSTVDWHTGQLNLKTNLRPVTQQDLLDKAAAAGADGGRFVSNHAESFSFGKKDS
ncbi:hypothetical protein EX895_001329 [Sporisorium graminicola]|uniref:Uncharacterized protein n=1 Tax=Sporisorium graminicola TaxID=280036 RepID=A0A4U7KXJ7_9BASI|nr:hypothetical protein EX895_001329 [Sporisorium graminicola]TKY89544.1 hypothetical protein EX895_001329 [Sporisorium graminicola]